MLALKMCWTEHHKTAWTVTIVYWAIQVAALCEIKFKLFTINNHYYYYFTEDIFDET